MFLGVLGFSGAVIFIIIFGGALLRQKKYASDSNRIEVGFIFRAGGVFDSVNLSFPFVSVLCDQNTLVVKYTGVELRIMYSIITSTEIINGCFSDGIKICYSSNGLNKEILIWTFYARKLRTFLRNINDN